MPWYFWFLIWSPTALVLIAIGFLARCGKSYSTVDLIRMQVQSEIEYEKLTGKQLPRYAYVGFWGTKVRVK